MWTFIENRPLMATTMIVASLLASNALIVLRRLAQPDADSST